MQGDREAEMEALTSKQPHGAPRGQVCLQTLGHGPPPPRVPLAPDTAPEVASAPWADPRLLPLCFGTSTKGPGLGQASQQWGDSPRAGKGSPHGAGQA